MGLKIRSMVQNHVIDIEKMRRNLKNVRDIMLIKFSANTLEEGYNICVSLSKTLMDALDEGDPIWL